MAIVVFLFLFSWMDTGRIEAEAAIALIRMHTPPPPTLISILGMGSPSKSVFLPRN
jgi:hypothetical protein